LKKGELVFVKFARNEWWVGTVIRTNAKEFEVQYADKDTETFSYAKPGTRILRGAKKVLNRDLTDEQVEKIAGPIKPVSKTPMREAREEFFKKKRNPMLVDYAEWQAWALKQPTVKDSPTLKVKGFVGKVDVSGKLYTKEGKLLRGGLPIGAGGIPGRVEMNPKYDPSKVQEGKDGQVYNAIQPNGNVGRVYTEEHWLISGKKKAEKVSDLVGNLDKVLTKWRQHLMQGGMNRQKIQATILELGFTTLIRIGTPGTKNVGLTTLQVKNLKVAGNVIHLDFHGKSGVKGDYKIPKQMPNNRWIGECYTVLKGLVEGKEPNDLVFSFEGEPITGTDVNRYLRTLGTSASVKTFRTLRGTLLAQKILQQSKFKRGQCTQREVEKWYKEEMKEVGKILNHKKGIKSTGAEQITSTTAIKSYIDPTTQIQFFKKLGLEVPKFLPKIGE
jgi:hypothetical protein